VLFLAGHDRSCDGTGQKAMEHEARFWINGNTHPRSLECQQQICKQLTELTAGTMVQSTPLVLSKGA